MPSTTTEPPNSLLTVVISAGQSRNPEKRDLERQTAERLAADGIQVLNIPHLYDLGPKSQSFETLRELDCDLVVLSWLYDRAAHWVLDRNGIRGQEGEVELKQETGEDEEDEEPVDESSEETVTSAQPRPDRKIYCIDFRASPSVDAFVAEVKRVLGEVETNSSPSSAPQKTLLSLESLARFDEPTNDTYLGAPPKPEAEPQETLLGSSAMVTIDEHPGRRWYPVIDFSRCTNCMECIDFCLFGVYGVDSVETIVVEQADNCRKGCPACSRVCPQNAIIFPQHKTPAIAGAPVDSSGLKIDLSKLFGAPDTGEDAATIAARERDEQLILAGRAAVGEKEEEPSASESIQARLAEKSTTDNAAKEDGLDDLLDELDALDL